MCGCGTGSGEYIKQRLHDLLLRDHRRPLLSSSADEYERDRLRERLWAGDLVRDLERESDREELEPESDSESESESELESESDGLLSESESELVDDDEDERDLIGSGEKSVRLCEKEG